ncbi:hypothetical protein GPX89_06710 [Nocardia sp. ET3-3]|uniref:RNA ligase domain-containing protein n=1 Tax=Nocardia terrae TaxID=2675851 RepID=A0A7K1URF9_9NOCA|nr:RNA ligase family protein [Nocardia terrae]MVU76935.1 hypothetical protein [Nocardia terrae]
MNFDVRAANLEAINSATKYPSIQTYHQLGEKGSLTETVTAFTGPVIGTEKIDGTNARIVLLPDGSWLLGSREELLHARGDLIANPALGIVAALRELAESLSAVEDRVRVYFLELYGGKVTAASTQYTGERSVGYRLFDVLELRDVEAILDQPVARISAWRESGGQYFLPEPELLDAARVAGIEITPRLFTLDGADLPGELTATRDFLATELPTTRSALDGGAGGRPEGIVLRSPDRSVIAKARVEDYERTLRRLRPSGRR